MDAKTLNRKIDALGKKTEKWRDEVQQCLVFCAQRAFDEAHRDVDGFNRLIQKLQGSDLNAVTRWIVKHAPAVFNSKQDTPYGKGGFKYNNSFEGEYDALYLLGQAWWEKATRPEQARPEFFDLDESINALIKRIATANKKGLKVVGIGNTAQVLAMAAGVTLAEKQEEKLAA